MKNHWLDKRYPLAAAVRDYRKGKDALSMQALEQVFHEMALKILALFPPAKRNGKLLELMEAAAWEVVERFDLRKKAQAFNYFTNAMLFAARVHLKLQQTQDEKDRLAALRRQSIRTALRKKP